ncbi:hypothetical protein [Ciceribacter azotifigens]|uniref:hypothetical protein n=1 Tax=Ciceribacter azotifigens TaxID=2069303 RepID=UPI003A86E63C
MLGFLFRFLSLVALCIAVATGVLDSIASVSASGTVVTPLGIAWIELSPDTLSVVSDAVQRTWGPKAWGFAIRWLLPLPAFAVFLALSLLLWMIGYKRRPAAGRFAA